MSAMASGFHGGISCSILVLFLIISFVFVTNAQTEFAMTECSNTSGNYTTNSTYRKNLETLLSSLSSHTEITYGFYNFSAGSDPNRVYATAHCRADLNPKDCRSCVDKSSTKLLETCPNQKEAFGWFEKCMVRFSNKTMYGVLEMKPRMGLLNVVDVENKTLFNEKLNMLLDDMRDQAASGDSQSKDAMSNISLSSSFMSLYGLSQCTPDLSRTQCITCLDWLANFIPSCCNGKQGARFCTPSCYLRYELEIFYDPEFNVPPPPPLAPPPSASSPESPSLPANGKRSKTARTIVIIVVPTVVLGVFVIFICICLFLRSRKLKENVGDPGEIASTESLQFEFSTIRDATDNFSDANKLGQGGFGAVYKGLLPDGQYIAAKRLSKDSGQGDLEFKNEVVLMANLQHRNLVRLLGFCLERNERLLVYEYLPNTSLDHYIFDRVKRQQLDWDRRYKIIGGIARGLLYLHEDSRIRIIHRDLKASNILLDVDMNAKISDFGMARLFGMDQTQGDTSRIVGTYGYMAPEYAMHGQFSLKTDVFSFGVLVLEILTGQKNNCFRNGDNVEDLLSSAWKKWREGTGINLVDPMLREGGSTSEMMRCIHIGLLCVQENVAERPNMATVVLMLNSYSLSIPVPAQPAFFMHTNVDLSGDSSAVDYSSGVTDWTDQSGNRVIEMPINQDSTHDLYPR